jgi:MFS family permease
MAMGFSVAIIAAGSNTLLQTWVRDDMRGRVMATFTMAFLGVAPLGSLAVGSLAHVVGVRPVLVTCGILTVLVGLGHIHLSRTPGGTDPDRPASPLPRQ